MLHGRAAAGSWVDWRVDNARAGWLVAMEVLAECLSPDPWQHVNTHTGASGVVLVFTTVEVVSTGIGGTELDDGAS